MANQDIKRAAAGKGVCLWQVAMAIGMNDAAFSRKLRTELPNDKKTEILEIIDRLAAGEEICKPVRKRRKPMTNADRIRAMDDETLATQLVQVVKETFEMLANADMPDDLANEIWVQLLEKLKQPAEEDNDGRNPE